jgi:hypothetical protein
VDDEGDPRDSSFRLEVSVSVGYQRKRAALGGAWEGHITTAVLLIGGTVLVLLVVLRALQIL